MNKKETMLEVIDGGDPVRAQAAAWFARLRADDVRENDRQRWRNWLESDPRHREAYERYERLWSELGDFALSPELARRMPKRHAFPQRRNLATRALRWFAGSAAVALAMFGGWKLLSPPPVQEEIYASAVGERRSVALADGTRVDLDTDTHLRVRYSERERHIALDHGRAFFRVARDPSRPLSVEAPEGGVRAIGTQFEVYRRGHGIDVALFEGKVRLHSTARDGTPTVLGVLTPGQRARVATETPLRVETFQPAESPGWVNGRLVFDDLPLSAAVEEFNRYGGRRIDIADAKLGALRVSGVFRSDDSSGFVEALRVVYGVSTHVDPDGKTQLTASSQ